MTLRIITSIITFFAALSFSFAQSGDLVVFSTDGAAFHVAMDSKFQNKKATTNLKVTNIPEGDYWVTLLFNNDRKAVKSNLRVRAGQENSFVVDKDGGSWKLKTYSTVPQSQVGMASSSQIRVRFDKAGVEIDGMDSAKELAKSEVEQNPEYVRVHGTRDELKMEAEKKRRGQYSGTVADQEAAPAAAAPQVQEGTTLTKRYIESKNTDGSVTITEEMTTITKEIVERNGQQQVRTKRNVILTPTDYICLPMETEKFEAMLTRVNALPSNQRLAATEKEIKDQCLTPDQIRKVGDIFDKDELELFAMAAQPTAADPNNYPYETEVVAMIEEPMEEIAPEPVLAPEREMAGQPKEEPQQEVVTAIGVEREEKELNYTTKTKAELRAERKAEKARLKAERKAARAKAKAERKAARERAKAERAKS